MSENIEVLNGEDNGASTETSVDDGFKAYYAEKNNANKEESYDAENKAGDDSHETKAPTTEYSDSVDNDTTDDEAKIAPEEEIELPQEDKSWLGRLKKSQGENDLLRKRIMELEQRAETAHAHEPVRANIPDDIKEDIAEFQKAYPQLALAAEMPGLEGDIIRRQIAEYGADYAAGTALSVMKDYNQRQAQIKKEEEDYKSGVFSKRPDIKDMPAKEYKAYSMELYAWILRKPEEEQDRLLKAYNAEAGYNTSDHLVDLFNEFDKSREQSNINTSKQNKRRQLIDEGLAVPASAYLRGSSVSSGAGGSTDPQKRGFDDYFKKRRS